MDIILNMGLPFYDTLDGPLTYWAMGISGSSFDRICRSTDGVNWTTWRTFTSPDPRPQFHTIFRDSQGRIYISGIWGKPGHEYSGLFRLTVAAGQSPAEAGFEAVIRYQTQVTEPHKLVCVRPWGIVEDSQGNVYAAESQDTWWGTLWRIPRDNKAYVVFKSDMQSIQFVGGSTTAQKWSEDLEHPERDSWMRHIHGIGCSRDDRIFFVVGDGGNGPKALARGLWVFDPFRNSIGLNVPGQPYGNPPGGRPGVFWQEDWTTQWTDVAFTGPDELHLPADTVGATAQNQIWRYLWQTHWASIASLDPPLTGLALRYAKYSLRAVNPNELWFTLPTDNDTSNASTGLYRMRRPSIDSTVWSNVQVLGPADLDPVHDNLHIQDLAVDRHGRIPATADYVFTLAWSWRHAWQDGDEYPRTCTLVRVPRSNPA